MKVDVMYTGGKDWPWISQFRPVCCLSQSGLTQWSAFSFSFVLWAMMSGW